MGEPSKYVSSEAQAVLVPRSHSLRTLPSLDERAQLSCPVLEDACRTLYDLGWADHGSLVVMAWCLHRSPTAMLVAVHSSSDGSCRNTLLLDRIQPPVGPVEYGASRSCTFSVCSDQPVVAVTCAMTAYMLLLNLATCMETVIMRRDHLKCYLHWAPQGRHLMLREVCDEDEECVRWLCVDTASCQVLDFQHWDEDRDDTCWS